MRETLWDHPGQEEQVREVVRRHPRKPGEWPLGYIHRIAVLAGLLADPDVESVDLSDDTMAAAEEWQRGVRRMPKEG